MTQPGSPPKLAMLSRTQRSAATRSIIPTSPPKLAMLPRTQRSAATRSIIPTFTESAYADSVNVGMMDLVAALRWVRGNIANFGGDVGMMDLVAALRWVRDNIANFGGDPGCVMIYGQSGGGSKVTTLLGMPSAEG